MNNFKYLLIPLAAVFAASCQKPYNPPAVSSPGTYVVVEGTINVAGVTSIKLSNTVGLASAGTESPVTGATVTIQGSGGGSYPLTEVSKGYYQSASLTLSNTQQYRLSFSTSNGQQYVSEYESALASPPIDSVGYTITANGLQLYVNTHDPTNITKYYRWDYNETWQFHADFQSFYITNGHAIVPRTPAQDIYSCFSSDTASNVILASTAHLAQSVVYQNPLTSVASTSEKIETEYSIQVTQYALSGEAYTFWSNLKEDTENLGSIFDPQPSNISGNIHNMSNPSAVVVGYIGVCALQTKRIFISRNQLPQPWFPTYPYNCGEDSVSFKGSGVQIVLVPPGSPSIPIILYSKGGAAAGYISSDVQCVDCTIRGTQVVPSFWPTQQ